MNCSYHLFVVVVVFLMEKKSVMSQMFTFAKVWQWLSYSDEQSSLAKNQPVSANRPLYRYGGHIELIRFKEYYRMPRGHEHISVVFSSAFRDIFS